MIIIFTVDTDKEQRTIPFSQGKCAGNFIIRITLQLLANIVTVETNAFRREEVWFFSF